MIYIVSLPSENPSIAKEILSIESISKKLIDKCHTMTIIGSNGEHLVDIGSIRSMLRLLNEETEKNFSTIGRGLLEEWSLKSPDQSSTNSILFIEFMAYLIMCTNGSSTKKLSMLFYLLEDSHEKKTISLDSLTWLYHVVYAIAGKERPEEYVNAQVETVIDALISKLMIQHTYPISLHEKDFLYASTQLTFYLGETLAEFLDAFTLKVKTYVQK